MFLHRLVASLGWAPLLACALGLVSGCKPVECPESQTDCDGTCVDLQESDDNCGACGTTCSGSETCIAGGCSSNASVELQADVSTYYGDGIPTDLGTSVDALAIYLAPPFEPLAGPPQPELDFMELPSLDADGPTDSELAEASLSPPPQVSSSCPTCQPPGPSCNYGVVGWYKGWCSSLCTYASACLCVQPDPWDPNLCLAWSDEWAFTGCPGPNPCSCF
jgi:hypothetical protein